MSPEKGNLKNQILINGRLDGMENEGIEFQGPGGQSDRQMEGLDKIRKSKNK